MRTLSAPDVSFTAKTVRVYLHEAGQPLHIFRTMKVVMRRPAPDGSKSYWSISGLPVFDETGRFIGHRGVGRDITERKRAEEALRRSEAYLAEAQKLSNSGAFAFNAEGSIYWSEQLYRIWGFDPLKGIPSRD